MSERSVESEKLLREALKAALVYLDNSDSPGGCNGKHEGCGHCRAIAMVRTALRTPAQQPASGGVENICDGCKKPHIEGCWGGSFGDLSRCPNLPPSPASGPYKFHSQVYPNNSGTSPASEVGRVLKSFERAVSAAVYHKDGCATVLAEQDCATLASLPRPQEQDAAAKPSAVGSATEYAWLIEAGWTDTASIEYWCGCVVTGGGGIQHEWSFDHSRAIRFARKEDAKRIAGILIDGESYRIVEHGWDAAPAPSPAVSSTEQQSEPAACGWLVKDGLGGKELFLDHDRALRAFDAWGKEIGPVYYAYPVRQSDALREALKAAGFLSPDGTYLQGPTHRILALLKTDGRTPTLPATDGSDAA